MSLISVLMNYDYLASARIFSLNLRTDLFGTRSSYLSR